MSIWCVKPEEVTIELRYVAPDGSAHPLTIRVKKHLTIGEQRDMETSGWRGRTWRTGEDGALRPEIQIDWKLQMYAQVETYLLDWSLTDDDGKKLPVPVREVLQSLEPDVFELINDAITTHMKAMALEKKATAGARAPSRMSA